MEKPDPITAEEHRQDRQIALEHAVSLCENGKIADDPGALVEAAEQFLKFLQGANARS